MSRSLTSVIEDGLDNPIRDEDDEPVSVDKHRRVCVGVVSMFFVTFPPCETRDLAYSRAQSSFALLPQADWKKFKHYHIEVSSEQDDKAKELLLCSFARPHMRAFHCSWCGFFIAFFIWFAISPLLPYIREDLGLTKQQIWSSSIAGVGKQTMSCGCALNLELSYQCCFL